MADRSLDSLSSIFKPIIFELLARLLERGEPVMIIETGRTSAEHAQQLAAGASAVSVSKHQPRSDRGFTLATLAVQADLDKADAIDLAPYAQFTLHGANKLQWDASDPAWLVIGEEAEKLGLRWGGRWDKPVDPGHCELVFPADELRLAVERGRPWPPPGLKTKEPTA